MSRRGRRGTRSAGGGRARRGVWRASSGRSGTRTRRRARAPAGACPPLGTGAAVARSASRDPPQPSQTEHLFTSKRKTIDVLTLWRRRSNVTRKHTDTHARRHVAGEASAKCVQSRTDQEIRCSSRGRMAIDSAPGAVGIWTRIARLSSAKRARAGKMSHGTPWPTISTKYAAGQRTQWTRCCERNYK